MIRRFLNPPRIFAICASAMTLAWTISYGVAAPPASWSPLLQGLSAALTGTPVTQAGCVTQVTTLERLHLNFTVAVEDPSVSHSDRQEMRAELDALVREHPPVHSLRPDITFILALLERDLPLPATRPLRRGVITPELTTLPDLLAQRGVSDPANLATWPVIPVDRPALTSSHFGPVSIRSIPLAGGFVSQNAPAPAEANTANYQAQLALARRQGSQEVRVGVITFNLKDINSMANHNLLVADSIQYGFMRLLRASLLREGLITASDAIAADAKHIRFIYPLATDEARVARIEAIFAQELAELRQHLQADPFMRAMFAAQTDPALQDIGSFYAFAMDSAGAGPEAELSALVSARIAAQFIEGPLRIGNAAHLREATTLLRRDLAVSATGLQNHLPLLHRLQASLVDRVDDVLTPSAELMEVFRLVPRYLSLEDQITWIINRLALRYRMDTAAISRDCIRHVIFFTRTTNLFSPILPFQVASEDDTISPIARMGMVGDIRLLGARDGAAMTAAMMRLAMNSGFPAMSNAQLAAPISAAAERVTREKDRLFERIRRAIAQHLGPVGFLDGSILGDDVRTQTGPHPHSLGADQELTHFAAFFAQGGRDAWSARWGFAAPSATAAIPVGERTGMPVQLPSGESQEKMVRTALEASGRYMLARELEISVEVREMAENGQQATYRVWLAPRRGFPSAERPQLLQTLSDLIPRLNAKLREQGVTGIAIDARNVVWVASDALPESVSLPTSHPATIPPTRPLPRALARRLTAHPTSLPGGPPVEAGSGRESADPAFDDLRRRLTTPPPSRR